MHLLNSLRDPAGGEAEVGATLRLVVRELEKQRDEGIPRECTLVCVRDRAEVIREQLLVWITSLA